MSLRPRRCPCPCHDVPGMKHAAPCRCQRAAGPADPRCTCRYEVDGRRASRGCPVHDTDG